MKPPKKWKSILIIWLAIYPTITILFAIGGPYFAQIQPLAVRTLVITAIVVPLMVLILIPVLNRIFRNWLDK